MAAQFNRFYSASRCMTVSSSYVHYTVQDNQLAILRKRREIKAQKPSAPLCNAVWGVDMSGKFDTSGKLHMMLGVLDHGSRKALALVALPNKTSWTLLGYLCLAIGRYGKPIAIRTDNERVFTSGVFQLGLRIAGIRHQRIKAGCPWQNGRIERFFGTLKQSLDSWQVATSANCKPRLMPRLVLLHSAACTFGRRDARRGLARDRSASIKASARGMVRGVGWPADWISNTPTMTWVAISKSKGAVHSRRGGGRPLLSH